jgi:hypothetical protein
VAAASASAIAPTHVGLLERDEDAAGGFTELARKLSADSVNVVLATAEGRATTYEVARGAAESEGRRTVTAAGLAVESNRAEDAGRGRTTRRTTGPDGTVTTVRTVRDPRFPAADVMDSMQVRTPGDLVSPVKGSRTVTLADSANPFSLLAQLDSLVADRRDVEWTGERDGDGRLRQRFPSRRAVDQRQPVRVLRLRSGWPPRQRR